jgi:hypothetical protein
MGERLSQRAAGIDRLGINRQTGALFRNPRAGSSKAEIAAHDVRQIPTVGAIEHGEGGVQRRAIRLLAQ